MKRIVIAAMVCSELLACATLKNDTSGLAQSAQPDDCAADHRLAWKPDGTVGCEPTPEWPPASSGSRFVPGTCALKDGAYAVSWTTDEPSDTRPAFSVVKQMTIASDVMTLATLGKHPYRLQWEDSATAFVSGDRVVEFTVWCEGDGGVQGTYIVDLPYYHPSRQIETWSLTGYLTQPTTL